MRTHPFKAAARAALLAGLFAAASASPASALLLSAGSGSGAAGRTVDIAITSGSTTGLGVVSFTFDLSYNATLVTATDVLEAGTSARPDGVTRSSTSPSPAAPADPREPRGFDRALRAGEIVRIRFRSTRRSSVPRPRGSRCQPDVQRGRSAGDDHERDAHDPRDAGHRGLAEHRRGDPHADAGVLGVGRCHEPGHVVHHRCRDRHDVAGRCSPASRRGRVRVVAVDNAGRRDTTDGVVNVRGMGLTAGSGSTFPNLASLCRHRHQRQRPRHPFRPVHADVQRRASTATGVTTPAGTFARRLGPGAVPGPRAAPARWVSRGLGSRRFGHAMFLQFAAWPLPIQPHGDAGVVQRDPAGEDDEQHQRAVDSRHLDQPRRGHAARRQTQVRARRQSDADLAWSVVDPTVASINGAGLLTALAGGVTRVRAQDVGAIDFTTSLTVYDLRVTPDTVTVMPGRSSCSGSRATATWGASTCERCSTCSRGAVPTSRESRSTISA